jgi:16S rRNA (guanine966-N2)-methyltransferase
MSRIIAGTAGGRRLVTPSGARTRPTADRAREGLFSSLTSSLGSLDGIGFLDLYAGSGAVGLEAASRGAARVVLVEHDPGAVRAIRANLAALELPGVELRSEPVERVLAAPAASGFDVVFADPPYDDPVDDLLAGLVSGDWLARDAVVCVERASRGALPVWPPGIEALRTRRYGEGTLCYGRAS